MWARENYESRPWADVTNQMNDAAAPFRKGTRLRRWWAARMSTTVQSEREKNRRDSTVARMK
jgi:hypothetical protein